MKLELGQTNQKNRVTASGLFNSVQHIYKAWDYRCLVPYSNKDPTKWKTYDMHDYRKASSEVELKRVDQYKHDNNFYNWEDPKVLKYFAKNPKKAWKKTYGFPYVSAISWDGLSVSPSNATKCFKKCARYVSSYFTKSSYFNITNSRSIPSLPKNVERRADSSNVVLQLCTLMSLKSHETG